MYDEFTGEEAPEDMEMDETTESDDEDEENLEKAYNDDYDDKATGDSLFDLDDEDIIGEEKEEEE